MASIFFEDYQFPSELYNRDTGDFSTPVRTLLDFAPHILQELPKKAKDQKPMNAPDEDSWTKSTTPKSYLGTLITSERAHAIAEFMVRCGNEYLKTSEDKRRREEEYKQFEKRYRQEQRRQKKGWFNFNSTDSEDEEEEEKRRLEEEQERLKKLRKKEAEQRELVQKQKDDLKALAPHSTTSTIAKSAVAASVLSLSLYSTYQASVKFSEVSFHNQLEILINQVEAILQSTQIWIEEHDKLGDKIPTQIRSDVVQLREIVDYIVRLDPRSNKKMEAAGWSCGAIGGLSALGGLALGSAAVATGGAALAVGGMVVMVSSKAQSKSHLGARLLLENQIRDKVSACQKARGERAQMIDQGFEIETKKETVKLEPKTSSTRFVVQEPYDALPSVPKKKIAIPN
ncbi:hypothetical protein A0J61_04044 [Choanephora cucurbitarum]|uniref:Uncharacterized protein n=1 Tax=Choanephora cucurbitarum TaxID=101091 RepID=A0A1C7NFR2_9FUNG|nr:hypothetical protein A0J61_04044 [Choanephora cucurbitarum]